jgi:glutamyl-tRNA synthetase
MSVITRIAPSPTGRLHIGTARTALFNYLFAKHNGGAFLVRSEDTDKARSQKEFEEEILEGLAWLGLKHDSFSRQSENAPRHQELLEKLIGEGKAYRSKEPGKDDPEKEVEVIRLKNPGKEVTFKDLVHDDITFDTTELKDFVIARSLHEPLYHFAVVVDDWDAEVTHVIRGEDHISNTPRQILLQEALGAPQPHYAHIPLILNPDRTKLSKRSGPTSVMDYREDGFLPEALVNYLALLGWGPGDDREEFTLEELEKIFSLEGIHKSGAVFDKEKLLAFNQRVLRTLSPDAFIFAGGLPENAREAVPLLKERARTFSEAKEMLGTELAFLFEEPTIEKNLLVKQEGREGRTVSHLSYMKDAVASMKDGVAAKDIRSSLMPYADKEGRGEVLWPLRYALSGQERSPDPFTLISILGPKESVERIRRALDILGG